MSDINVPRDINDVIGVGGAPYAGFPTAGTTHRGKIVGDEVQQQTTLEGEPKFWPDGRPMWMGVLTLQTDERDPQINNDDGQRRLFIKGHMVQAIRDALKQAGADRLEHGGMIAVRYDRDGERKSPGMNPPKLYVAQYKPPSPVADLLGNGAASTSAPTAAPAPAGHAEAASPASPLVDMLDTSSASAASSTPADDLF
jgi:hypothetical protein